MSLHVYTMPNSASHHCHSKVTDEDSAVEGSCAQINTYLRQSIATRHTDPHSVKLLQVEMQAQ